MNAFLYTAIICVCIYIVMYLCRSRQRDKYQNTNIYGETLEPCRETGMDKGSWMLDGTCSETDGGVHQICIKNIANNANEFSKKTGQDNWSDKRKNDNHCVCLGAWSLYVNTQDDIKDNILKCESIPKIALSKKYVSRFSEGWNKWNGLEIPNQIKDGVNELMNQCYDSTSSDKKYARLQEYYCLFAKEVPALKNSNTYRELCRNLN